MKYLYVPDSGPSEPTDDPIFCVTCLEPIGDDDEWIMTVNRGVVVYGPYHDPRCVPSTLG